MVEPPEPVEGAEGSIVVFSDARALANAVIERTQEGAAALFAQSFTAPLRELNGSVRADGDGVRGRLKLTIE